MNLIVDVITGYTQKILLPAIGICVVVWCGLLPFVPHFRSWAGAKLLGEVVIKTVITLIVLPLLMFTPFIFVSWLSGHAQFR